VRAYPAPGDPGRHLSRISFYMKGQLADQDNAELAAYVGNIAESFALVIRDEDYVMSASQQTAANAGALETIIFGRNEPMLHHYHNTYRSKLGLDLLPLLADADVTV
jgi:hypothetical protein